MPWSSDMALRLVRVAERARLDAPEHPHPPPCILLVPRRAEHVHNTTGAVVEHQATTQRVTSVPVVSASMTRWAALSVVWSETADSMW